MELTLEMELIKRRLEDTDPSFKKFQLCFQDLIKYFKTSKQSPYEFFQRMDVNKDGKIGQEEFQ